MHTGGIMFAEIILAVFLSSIAVSDSARQYGACIPKKDDCDLYSFKCSNGVCIKREKYCNGYYDCTDRSDEEYCKPKSHRTHSGLGSTRSTLYCAVTSRNLTLCSNEEKCIPDEWKCDGRKDCRNGDDENNCGNFGPLSASIHSGRNKAIQWLHNKKILESATRKWGPLVPKTAVALYLSDPSFLQLNSSVRSEITYELTIHLLSKLSQKRIENLPSSYLASFINAFLVTCIDPRNFHGFNLVQELRTRVEKQNSTNPYAYLALCNAGDAITESDVKKLTEMFWGEYRELWTDTQAVVVMALSCARNQPDSSVDSDTLSELVLELKNRQSRNGTVENLHNTILVLQALYAAEKDEDPDNFDEKKALSYIMQNQKSDGSFKSLSLTYYALPILSCKSLVDINNTHCVKVPKDEDTAVFDLINHPGAKIRVYYSIWIGMDLDIQKTLALRVPPKASFYEVMKTAAEIDSKFKFEYIVKDRKPYINALSGIMDDTESGQFWFPYTLKNKTAVLLKQSTADIIPKDEDHIVMWYRPGSWLG